MMQWYEHPFLDLETIKLGIEIWIFSTNYGCSAAVFYRYTTHVRQFMPGAKTALRNTTNIGTFKFSTFLHFIPNFVPASGI